MNKILESNKLIAEFLWGKQSNPIDKEPEWYIGCDLPYVDEDGYYMGIGAMMPITLENIQFHTSYDWLMPVITKLQEVTEEPEELDELKNALWFNSIEYVYQEVVDCIKNHNDNKN